MAATQARIGYGVTLARGDGASPEVFTSVVELIDITPPSMTKDQIEATHHASPGGFREFIPGMKDGGEFTAVFNWIKSHATQGNASGGLLNDFLNQDTPRNWRISFPGSPVMTWTFRAVVTGFNPSTPIDDRMTVNATFKVSGAPTVA